MDLSDDELTYEVIGGFRRVYNHYGFGLLESAYSAALVHVWRSNGLAVEREVPVPLYFDSTIIAHYRIDLIVEGRLLVEVKACQTLKPDHIKQVFHYLNSNSNSLGKLQEEAGNG